MGQEIFPWWDSIGYGRDYSLLLSALSSVGEHLTEDQEFAGSNNPLHVAMDENIC